MDMDLLVAASVAGTAHWGLLATASGTGGAEER